MSPARALVVAIVVACAACRATGTFACATTDQCQGGRCEATGFCSFDDTACPSGYRYDPYAGGGFAGQCVPLGAADAGIDGPKLDGSGGTPFCDATDANLVACYEFENTVADASSHHNNPTIMINVSYGAGQVGRALLVSPTTEVDVPDSSSFNVSALTIEAWIDPAAIPTGTARAGILDCQNRYGFFLHPNGDLICTAGGSVTAAANVQPNRWTHVACTNDGASLRIYVNGSLAAMAAAGPPATGGVDGITLGGNNPPGGGDPLDGALDELRLFSVARSATQICTAAGRTTCP
jgi:hypothetical protein